MEVVAWSIRFCGKVKLPWETHYPKFSQILIHYSYVSCVFFTDGQNCEFDPYLREFFFKSLLV